MEKEEPWTRGRHNSWSSDGREKGGGTDSPRRMHHSGSPSHKHETNHPVWDDTVNDLALMCLTPAELARKLATRQSSNMVLARAQLLDQSRRAGPQGISLPPGLAARIQAARQQSVDSILAQSNSTLLASQKVRHTEPTSRLEGEQADIEQQGRVEVDPPVENQNQKFQHNTDPKERGIKARSESNHNSSVNAGDKAPEEKTSNSHKNQMNVGLEKVTPASESDISKRVVEQRLMQLKTAREAAKPVDRRQIAATRTSLDNTITMVINTCKELWLQLEEERLTREHLQQQLQQQGNVITTLTAELLQIQEQQEAILHEVTEARTSGLWGTGEVEVAGDGETLPGHIPSSKLHGHRPSPHQPQSRHPQRSILRATRTIHQPHQRQSPQSSLGRTQQPNHPSVPLSHRPPHSPRPHQPSSRSQSHNLQTYLASPPPPEPPLSPRPETASSLGYKTSVSRQIRDALGNGNGTGKSLPRSRDRNSLPSQSYPAMAEEALQRDVRESESQGTLGNASDDKFRASNLPLDQSLPDHRERIQQ